MSECTDCIADREKNSFNDFMCYTNLYTIRIHIITKFMYCIQKHTQIHAIYEFLQSDLLTHLVFEFKLTPIQFLTELFIDSTGDVVMASNDMEMVFRT
jgi:hypothetical protein